MCNWQRCQFIQSSSEGLQWNIEEQFEISQYSSFDQCERRISSGVFFSDRSTGRRFLGQILRGRILFVLHSSAEQREIVFRCSTNQSTLKQQMSLSLHWILFEILHSTVCLSERFRRLLRSIKMNRSPRVELKTRVDFRQRSIGISFSHGLVSTDVE